MNNGFRIMFSRSSVILLIIFLIAFSILQSNQLIVVPRDKGEFWPAKPAKTVVSQNIQPSSNNQKRECKKGCKEPSSSFDRLLDSLGLYGCNYGYIERPRCNSSLPGGYSCFYRLPNGQWDTPPPCIKN